MKLKNYKLELAHRIESTSGATWVGKKDTLLVARVKCSNESTTNGTASVGMGSSRSLRKPVEGNGATVARAGDKWACSMLRGRGFENEHFELRTLKDLKPARRIEEERPGYCGGSIPTVLPWRSVTISAALNVWDA